MDVWPREYSLYCIGVAFSHTLTSVGVQNFKNYSPALFPIVHRGSLVGSLVLLLFPMTEIRKNKKKIPRLFLLIINLLKRKFFLIEYEEAEISEIRKILQIKDLMNLF